MKTGIQMASDIITKLIKQLDTKRKKVKNKILVLTDISGKKVITPKKGSIYSQYFQLQLLLEGIIRVLEDFRSTFENDKPRIGGND